MNSSWLKTNQYQTIHICGSYGNFYNSQSLNCKIRQIQLAKSFSFLIQILLVWTVGFLCTMESMVHNGNIKTKVLRNQQAVQRKSVTWSSTLFTLFKFFFFRVKFFSHPLACLLVEPKKITDLQPPKNYFVEIDLNY